VSNRVDEDVLEPVALAAEPVRDDGFQNCSGYGVFADGVDRLNDEAGRFQAVQQLDFVCVLPHARHLPQVTSSQSGDSSELLNSARLG
jgi:hypothetical protein